MTRERPMREYRAISEFALEEADGHTISGYAVKWDTLDAYGTVFERHAFDRAIDGTQDITPRLLWAHNEFQPPIGTIENLNADAEGLRFVAHLNDTRLAQDVREAISSGSLEEISFGFTTTEEQRGDFNGARVRFVQAAVLWDISPVNFGAMPGASVEEIRSAIGHLAAHLPDGDREPPELTQNVSPDETRTGAELSSSNADTIRARLNTIRMELDALEEWVASKSYMKAEESDDDAGEAVEVESDAMLRSLDLGLRMLKIALFRFERS